jgi:hypothetical protein
MIELHSLALIHAEIDGELDTQRRAELARQLLAEPQFRALREDLKRVCDTLDGVAAVEPPPQLRASILAALPPVLATPAPPRRAAWATAPAARWRYAALFAGALVAATVLYKAGNGRSPDANEVAGTLGGSAARSTVIVDSVHLELDQVTGRASLYRATTGLNLELQLIASAPVDVLVASGGQTQRISGLGPRTAIALPDPGPGAQTVDLSFLVGGRPIGGAQLRVPARD